MRTVICHCCCCYCCFHVFSIIRFFLQ